MAYSLDVVKRARARLAQAKEDRESENRQHLAEAYRKVPRIREIDMELRRTMALAAQAAFQQGSDGRDLMEKVRLQNMELQQERAILAMEHFEEGYLDDAPICDSSRRRKYPSSPAPRTPSTSSAWTTIPTGSTRRSVSVPGRSWSGISRSAVHTP